MGDRVKFIIIILHEHENSVSLAQHLVICTFSGSTFENLAMQQLRIRQLRRRLRCQILREPADGVLDVTVRVGSCFVESQPRSKDTLFAASLSQHVAHNIHLYSGRFSAVTSPSERLCEDFFFDFFLASTANARSTIRLWRDKIESISAFVTV